MGRVDGPTSHAFHAAAAPLDAAIGRCEAGARLRSARGRRNLRHGRYRRGGTAAPRPRRCWRAARCAARRSPDASPRARSLRLPAPRNGRARHGPACARAASATCAACSRTDSIIFGETGDRGIDGRDRAMRRMAQFLGGAHLTATQPFVAGQREHAVELALGEGDAFARTRRASEMTSSVISKTVSKVNFAAPINTPTRLRPACWRS